MSGEAIYRGYDRAALDAQYNNRARIPEFVDYFDRWLAWSAETRTALPGARDVAYGDLPVETLDVFPAERSNAPILIMIHGGYWYSLDKHHDSFVAEGCRPHGVATVVVNYGLAPDYRMDEIVRQNRAAATWVWRNAASFGGDASRIHVLGQSAGGHLAAMLLATDWPPFGADLPANLVKSAVSISGIYDLEPIRLCYLNDKVGLDAAEAQRNSPVAQRYPVPAPLMLVSGDIESAEYERQAEAMAAVWVALGYPLSRLALPGYNHFTMAEQLREPDSDLTRATMAQMGVAL
ncbi:MAG: alpha/beta hydrolase [Rhodospirillales bacterium]|nr:alpha/beta hydrolase [Rhodospirillales bacterium]